MISKTHDLETIHKLSFANELLLSKSTQAGCFDCLSMFPAADITSWIDDTPVRTAACPKCGTDAVLGDDGNGGISAELLQALHERYFKTSSKDGVVFESFTEAYEDYHRRKSLKS